MRKDILLREQQAMRDRQESLRLGLPSLKIKRSKIRKLRKGQEYMMKRSWRTKRQSVIKRLNSFYLKKYGLTYKQIKTREYNRNRWLDHKISRKTIEFECPDSLTKEDVWKNRR